MPPPVGGDSVNMTGNRPRRIHESPWNSWHRIVPDYTTLQAIDDFWTTADAKPLGTTIHQSGVSSTTQSSNVSNGQTQDQTFFSMEYDESGQLHFTHTRRVDPMTFMSNTKDLAVEYRRLDGTIATGWKGVQTHAEYPAALVRWDAFSDREHAGDTDYLTIGYWMIAFKDLNTGEFLVPIKDFDTGELIRSSSNVGVSATGSNPFNNDNIVGLTGMATYEGPATGIITFKDQLDLNFFGYIIRFFNAKAILEVDFGNTSTPGTISGRITEIMEEVGNFTLPDITLEPADILQATGGGHGGDFSGETSGATIKGEVLTGMWGGKLYGNGARSTDQPGSVAGTFGARTADNHNLSVEYDRISINGVFGAYKQ